jgi:hypothetical protein
LELLVKVLADAVSRVFQMGLHELGGPVWVALAHGLEDGAVLVE